jgi:uncharacterized protein YqhQ
MEKQSQNKSAKPVLNSTDLYGGQALIEGVMFKSKDTISFAVRKPNGKIHIEAQADTFKPNYFFRLPFVRGFVSLIRMSILGTKILHKSAEIATDDEVEDDSLTKTSQSESKQKESQGWLIATFAILAGVISVIFALGLFKAVPFFSSVFLAGYFGLSPIITLVIEGLIKLSLLLAYVYAISFIPDIRRVFMYHGAEHKVIRAYEAKKPLTVKNVAAASRFHPRCGTSFLVFVIGLSIIVYTIIPTDLPLWLRFIMRLLLLPVIAGLSFEFIQFTARVQEIPLLSWLKLPGYGVQLLTTKEPTDDQIEVALASFDACVTGVKKE